MSDSNYEAELSKRYRVQRLIRIGEWLEINAPILLGLFEAIDDAHTRALHDEQDDTLILEELTMTQMNPLRGLHSLLVPLMRFHDWGAKRENIDVTLHYPMACKKHEYEIVIPANPETKTES